MSFEEKKHPKMPYTLTPTRPVGKIVMGEEVAELPERKLNLFAQLVSTELTRHPLTMIQFSPSELLQAMREGRAVLYLDDKEDPEGFAQIWDLEQNPNGQRVLEFGSWVSLVEGEGLGSIVLDAGRQLASRLDPHAQLLALVEPENAKAQRVITKVGGIYTGMGPSTGLRTPGGAPLDMMVFDITKRV